VSPPAEEAMQAAKADAKANIGTAVHEFLERIELGDSITVPAPWDKDVAAYQETLASAKLSTVPGMIERTVVLEEFNLAGRFDRIVTFGSYNYIADLKTGETLDWSWGSIAIQLACYAHADSLYDWDTNTHEPMPQVEQDLALVIHLPAGQARCTLHWVDIAKGWEAAQHTHYVRKWRSNIRKLAEPWHPGEPHRDVAYRRNHMQARIDTLRGIDGALAALADAWPADIPTLKQAEQHTAEQLDEIDLILATVEAAVRAPFPTTTDINMTTHTKENN
jgi:hypothetical protein